MYERLQGRDTATASSVTGGGSIAGSELADHSNLNNNRNSGPYGSNSNPYDYATPPFSSLPPNVNAQYGGQSSGKSDYFVIFKVLALPY